MSKELKLAQLESDRLRLQLKTAYKVITDLISEDEARRYPSMGTIRENAVRFIAELEAGTYGAEWKKLDEMMCHATE
jgi:hypothetical protein